MPWDSPNGAIGGGQVESVVPRLLAVSACTLHSLFSFLFLSFAAVLSGYFDGRTFRACVAAPRDTPWLSRGRPSQIWPCITTRPQWAAENSGMGGCPPPPLSPSSPCHRSVVASFFLLSSRAEVGQNGRNGSRAADCFALCRDRTTGQGHGARAQTAGSSDCCVRSACSTHRGDHGPQARVFGCKLVPEGYVENHYGQGPWASPRHEGETRLHPL